MIASKSSIKLTIAIPLLGIVSTIANKTSASKAHLDALVPKVSFPKALPIFKKILVSGFAGIVLSMTAAPARAGLWIDCNNDWIPIPIPVGGFFGCFLDRSGTGESTGSGSSALKTPPEKDMYAAIWEKRKGPKYAAMHGAGSKGYQQRFNTFTKQGYRLTYINGHGSKGGKSRYTAIWEKKKGPAWVARHGMSASAYQKAFTKYSKQGYRLTHIDGYSAGGKARYAAIWEKKKGPAWVARHGMSASAYQKAFTKYSKQGYRLTQIDGYSVGGKDRYAAIWEKKKGPAWVARHRMSPKKYQQEFNKLVKKGYRLVAVSGYTRAVK